jgi:hypothetical protein
MYSSIILDCQTKKTNFSCEDCIAYKTCKIRSKTGQAENKKENAELQIMVDGAAAASEKHAVKRRT